MIGDISGAVIRCVAHRDAVGCGGGEVNIVEPNPSTDNLTAVYCLGDCDSRKLDIETDDRFAALPKHWWNLADLVRTENVQFDVVSKDAPLKIRLSGKLRVGINDAGCHAVIRLTGRSPGT